MTTGTNAIEALRKIHFDGHLIPTNAEYHRTLALDALSTKLEVYAGSIDLVLDEAYNSRCRQKHWHPVPFSNVVLTEIHAHALQFGQFQNKSSILKSKGFEALDAAAKRLGILLKLSIRPDSVAVICDFLCTKGEAVILAA